MQSDRELMQQALEALELAQQDAQIGEADYAITALRERLAREEREEGHYSFALGKYVEYEPARQEQWPAGTCTVTTMTTYAEPAREEPVAQFEDPRVQAVYDILCADEPPPAGEHWEGFTSRRIVDALCTAREGQEPVRVASPTAGMNLGERIRHVGGRENAAGYIEFGSVMAVDALIKHVLRDLAPQREWVGLSDEEMQDLTTNYFAEDWAVAKAVGLLADYEAKLREKNQPGVYEVPVKTYTHGRPHPVTPPEPWAEAYERGRADEAADQLRRTNK